VRLVARESRVESFRADIVARVDDGTDEGLPVVIENQYGRTDHAHLGKLVTYLASLQRGRGIWVVEKVAEAHRAAVDFLNRTSDESVGFALVVVRFAPGADGSHYIDFDVVAEPNLWVKAPLTVGGHIGGTPERREFLEQIADRVGPTLLEAGWAQVLGLAGRSPRVRLTLPPTHPLGGSVSHTVIRANRRIFTFRHSFRLGSFEQSWQLVETLRERYEEPLAETLAVEAEIQWHATETRAGVANDQLRIVHPGGGYDLLGVEEAAAWAAEVCSTWLRLSEDLPPSVLEELA
jgi:hypothetical protein